MPPSLNLQTLAASCRVTAWPDIAAEETDTTAAAHIAADSKVQSEPVSICSFIYSPKSFIQGRDPIAFEVHGHQTPCLMSAIVCLMIVFRVDSSTSASFFRYKQPFPVLCLPSFFSDSACRKNPDIKYKVRSFLRGEKPIRGHSPFVPLSYLYRCRPNRLCWSPTSEVRFWSQLALSPPVESSPYVVDHPRCG